MLPHAAPGPHLIAPGPGRGRHSRRRGRRRGSHRSVPPPLQPPSPARPDAYAGPSVGRLSRRLTPCSCCVAGSAATSCDASANGGCTEDPDTFSPAGVGSDSAPKAMMRTGDVTLNAVRTMPLEDVRGWVEHLRRRRHLRSTGGQLEPAALPFVLQSVSDFGATCATAMEQLENGAGAEHLDAIVKADCSEMAGEDMDAAKRIAKNQQRVRVYIENSVFLEGLYCAFPTEAATTTCLPFDSAALDALAGEAAAAGASAPVHRGELSYSMNGVGTMQVLKHYATQGLRSVGCNFAHPVRAGGHYEQGSRTQEEDLCRQAPNFWPSLVSVQASAGFCDSSGKDAGFHVDNGPTRRHAQIKVTSNVHVLRDADSKDSVMLPMGQRFRVSIVTVAAPCFHPNNLGTGTTDAQARLQATEFLESTSGRIAVKETMRNMILGPLTVDPGLEVLVLGGWGTGAYRLPWDLVMTLFHDVIVETNALQLYRVIHFPLFSGEASGIGQRFEGIWEATNIPARRALREKERGS